MHRAICIDASACCDQVSTIIDGRTPDRLPPHVDAIPFDRQRDLIDQWLRAADSADAVILIAPETDGILFDLLQAFRSRSLPAIACSQSIIDRTANKWAFANRMLAANVPHPKTMRLADASLDAIDRACLIKPIDGCGSMQIQRFANAKQACQACESEEAGSMIVQVLHRGVDASIACIARGDRIDWLPACRQSIEPESFAYRGGSGPLHDDLQARARRLGEATIKALLEPTPSETERPSLGGFLGIDMILGETAADDVVIEFNPRLTTSFIGIRELMETNLVARMLGLESERSPLRNAAVASVDWNPDGLVTVHAS